MKPFLLLLSAIIIISCSKEQVEKPNVPEPISFSQHRLMYDDKNAFIGTLAVIHFHRVESPYLIEQYKSLPARQAFCDDPNDTLVTVISKPCPADCGMK
jgi:hypothetical protein